MLPEFQKGLLLGQGNLKDELTTKTKIRCTLRGFFRKEFFWNAMLLVVIRYLYTSPTS